MIDSDEPDECVHCYHEEKHGLILGCTAIIVDMGMNTKICGCTNELRSSDPRADLSWL